jgi:DNA-binding CsgD family transcriptional regulator
LEEARSKIDLARGRLDASASGVATILGLAHWRGTQGESELGTHRVELALWQGRPEVAIQIVQNLLGTLRGTDVERFAARLLVLGMRACADLAGARDTDQLRDEQTATNELVGALEQMTVDPFGAHYFVAAVAEGADWRAETERAYGRDEPGVWETAAACWDRLGRPHRAAYARWRQAEALLTSGDRRAAADCLRVAWRQAEQHVPLRNALSRLARMARIDLSGPGAPVNGKSGQPTPYGLTERELDVLRLLIDGLTNSEIGARLYISRKTASVHVTSILRKLGATNRVHAAAIAQRAGVLDS